MDNAVFPIHLHRLHLAELRWCEPAQVGNRCLFLLEVWRAAVWMTTTNRSHPSRAAGRPVTYICQTPADEFSSRISSVNRFWY